MPKSKQTLERIAKGELDSQTQAEVQHHAARRSEAISKRIEELDREWPIDRVLMIGVGFNLLLGFLPGRVGSRTWYLFPAVVGGILLLHALQGWYPPLPILRRLGFRTRKEIDREKLALKAILGDLREPGTKTSVLASS